MAEILQPLKGLTRHASALATRLHPRRSSVDLERIALLQAELLARDNDRREPTDLAQVEFRVFSQFGDDGIVQYLTRRLAPPDSFVELGAEDYTEAATRLLLLKDNWRGLIVDSSAEHMNAVRGDELHWRHDLTTVEAFITAENVEELLARRPFGEIGLLSIDLDGNDYWVWEAVMTNPAIVVVEYNSVFGSERRVVVPYTAGFQRTQAHWSNLYWGASLPALASLAEAKGYRLVGSNGAGNNAYFVRAELVSGLPQPSAKDAYRESRYRESRNEQGELTYLAGDRRREPIASMPVLDLDTGEEVPVGDL
jgi:hypothetical protein